MSCWLTSRKSLLSYMPGSRTSGGIFDIAGKEARAAELDALTTTQEFWQDQEKAQAILKERATLTDVIAQWKKEARKLDDAQVFFELAEAGDPEAAAEVEKQLAELEKEINQAEMQRMLGGEHDAGNAIVSRSEEHTSELQSLAY